MIILIVIVSLSVLILIHELGHFLVAKAFGVRVDEFGLGFPPRLWRKKIGETVYSINLLPFGGFVRIYGENSSELPPENKDSLRSLAAKNFSQKSAVVLAGVFMNVVLGWFILSIVFMMGAPEHLAVAEIRDGSPAKLADLKTGDIIFNAEIEDQVLADPIKSEDFISLVKNAKENPIILKIQRGKDILHVNLAGRLNPPPGEGSLGVSLADIGFPAESFFASFPKATETTLITIKQIAIGFVVFFGKIFVSPEVIETVTGPVGIFRLVAEAGSLGLVYLLQLIALISLNLAVLNLIPFPALDGGRFLFFIFEKLKGSPISGRVQGAINAVGFFALIVLMILVTIQDVGRIIN